MFLRCRTCLQSSLRIHRTTPYLVCSTDRTGVECAARRSTWTRSSPARLGVMQLACLTADLIGPPRLRPSAMCRNRAAGSSSCFPTALVPSFTLYLCRVPSERFARGRLISRGWSCWFNQLGGKTESSRNPCFPGKMILGRTSTFPVLRAKAAVRRL